MVKFEDEMLILCQNEIFCAPNVVNFSVWFLQLTVWISLVASHITDPGWLLSVPSAVIKFIYSSSRPGTGML